MTQSFELSPNGRFARQRNMHRLNGSRVGFCLMAQTVSPLRRAPISNLQERISDNRILMSTRASFNCRFSFR
jgi:hypothetical protein